MKVLVFGGGGREHALTWAILRSARVSEVVCAPGNGGIATLGVGSSKPCRCVSVDGASVDAMIAVALDERPELTVIGPEVPLALGLVDALEKYGLRVFGPTRSAAMLETSKAFAKQFMHKNGIPTAAYKVCASADAVANALHFFKTPLVVKADGLAAGKGVVICETKEDAMRAASEMFSGALLGAPVDRIVLEEFLQGEELSFFAVCDGKHAVPLAAAQDHKRLGEGDTGPNTGGMGAYSTDTLLSAELRTWLMAKVAQPVVDGMAAQGTPYRGVLFCGMMLVPQADGTTVPMVLEFNTRFGDPETQALMMRLDSDIVKIFEAAIDGTADSLEIAMKPGASVCVIAASEGYPGKYSSGKPISGLDTSPDTVEVTVFHSGTALSSGTLLTAGGRVLGVTAYAADLRSALEIAFARIEEISFEGMQYRRDIGWRALRS